MSDTETDTADDGATETARETEVEVRLFADLAEAAGEGTVVVRAEEPTVAAALDALRVAHPGVGERLFDGEETRQGYTVALDGERVAPSAALDGGELAVFPPVTGGGRSAPREDEQRTPRRTAVTPAPREAAGGADRERGPGGRERGSGDE